MKDTIIDTLHKIGLSEKEAEVYLFISKRGLLTGTEIIRELKLNKGQAYRILKRLQKKGVIEKTFEQPPHFVSVPFEKVLDSYIKARRVEVNIIEKSKQNLLEDWKKISQKELESSVERFSVVEGKKKIVQKISEMFNNAGSSLVNTLSVADLLIADQFGAFDFFKRTKKNPDLNLSFKFIIQPKKKDLILTEKLIEIMPDNFEFRARNSKLGVSFLPRMIIRDNNELLLFVTNSALDSNGLSEDVCFCTNSKCIVDSFESVFEDCWTKSSTIENRINEFSNMNLFQTESTGNLEKSQIFYFDSLKSASHDIFILASAKELLQLVELNFIKNLVDTGIKIRIMTPVTRENFDLIATLQKYCEVKHVPVGYKETIIIDDKILFHINGVIENNDEFFPSIVHTKNLQYLKQSKAMGENLWESSDSLHISNLPDLFGLNHSDIKLENNQINSSLRFSWAKIEKEEIGVKKQSEIIEEFMHAKKHLVIDSEKDVNRAYQSTGHALIHPPQNLNLPKMLLHFYHVEKKSSFGREDAMQVATWMETPDGPKFVPIAMIGDNPKSQHAFKLWFKGIPLEHNIKLIQSDMIEIRVHGNSMFAAWSVPIELIDGYILPPSCVILEGYGKPITASYLATVPSGYTFKVNTNGFNAFVTYIHPKTKVSAPGTEGFLGRDEIMEIIPTNNLKEKIS